MHNHSTSTEMLAVGLSNSRGQRQGSSLKETVKFEQKIDRLTGGEQAAQAALSPLRHI
jgi:hypothetical protein